MPGKSNSNFAHSYFIFTSNSNPASWAALGELGSNVQATQGTRSSTPSLHWAGIRLRGEERSFPLRSAGAPVFCNAIMACVCMNMLPFSHPCFWVKAVSAYVLLNTRNRRHIASPKAPIIEIHCWKGINACRKQKKSVTVILKSTALHIHLCIL